MGFSQEWIGVHGTSRERFLAALRFRGTGRRIELVEEPFVALSLPNGWHFVIAEHAPETLGSNKLCASLSAESQVLWGAVVESTMFSLANMYHRGHESWSVVHEANQGREHLQVRGEPPPQFASIRDRCRAEQATGDSEVDYIFEIPVELAQSVTGYRYDVDPEGAGEIPFEVLERGGAAPRPTLRRRRLPAKPANPSLWRRLFGG